MPPLISSKQADYVEGLVKDAKQKGATLCQEFRRDGNLIYPLVLDRCTSSMEVAWKEPFGPILPIVRVESEQEALSLVNGNEFGLQGSLFTSDVNRAIRLSDSMSTGTVQVSWTPFAFSERPM